MLRIFFSVLSFLLLFSACNKTLKVKTGEDAFDVGQYAVAARLLEEEYNRTGNVSDRSNKAFLLGQSYERMNEPDQALRWFRVSADGSDSPSRMIYLAYALKNTGRYEEALTVFQDLGKQLNDPNRFRNELIYLNSAYQWQLDTETNPFKLELSPFNSPAADYSPVIRPDGKVVFTSDRSSNEGVDNYKWTGRSYSDLFVADSSATEAYPLQGLINTSDNEGSLIYAGSGQEVIFCRCFDRVGGDLSCKLLSSRNINGTWTDPQVLPFVADSLNYLSPSFGPDSNVLFFAVDDPKYNSAFDLYYSQRKDGVWQEAVRLPAVINTEYNEKFVTFDKDTMYFSSDRPSGMGGLDIYRTYISRGSWTPPLNMKSPVNSPYDDFSMVFDPGFEPTERILAKGFLSSNRKGGVGQDDIYHFTKIRTLPSRPVIDTPVIDDKSILVRLNVYTKGYEVSNGKMSSSTVELNGANVRVSSGGRDTSLLADKYGKISVLIKVDELMTISSAKEGYLTSSRSVSRDVIRIDSTKSFQEFSVIMNLYPVLYDQEIVIKDIYYDLDKYDIRKDAIGSLDELLSILRLNPSFKIKINSHTDCRGSNAYNMTLSANRAKSVVNYLTANGISRSRLTSQGYGESRPIANCACEQCNEEQHQLNRRTTFQLVK